MLEYWRDVKPSHTVDEVTSHVLNFLLSPQDCLLRLTPNDKHFEFININLKFFFMQSAKEICRRGIRHFVHVYER